MANKNVHGKIFQNVGEVKRILPTQNGGVVIVEEDRGLRVHGKVLTEKDGNYKRGLKMARAGAKMLNEGKEIKIIMA